jgi:aldehyde dehydrogenase (NAD+)
MDSTKNIPLSWAYSWLQKPKYQYIDGQWVAGAGTDKWVVTNPANRETLCNFAIADSDQVEYTANIANQQHESGVWSKISRTQRADMLRQIARLIRENVEELAVL